MHKILRRLAPSLAAAAVISGIFVAAPGGVSEASAATSGSFTSACAYGHRLSDDPIVAPNKPGGSHSHDFFGNTSTNAASTTGSLLANSTTTCARKGDTAAYWVPTLMKDGAAVPPRQMRVYYRTGGLKDVKAIKSFPKGFRMIAGDSKATSAQPVSRVSWACTLPGGGAEGDEIEVGELPSDCNDQPLRMRIVFPNCWNGRDLDSADHKSHVAYSSRGSCPTTHPVALPQITMSIRYWIAGPLTGIALASHSTYSGHADFFNSWRQSQLDGLVSYCLRGSRSCGETGGPTTA